MALHEKEFKLMNVTGNDMTFYRLDWLSFVCSHDDEEEKLIESFDYYIEFLNELYYDLGFDFVAVSGDVESKHGRFGYVHMITDERSGISIFLFPSENYSKDTRLKMGTLFQFSGKFFDLLKHEPREYCGILYAALAKRFDNIRCTRLDIARDFFNSPFNMDYLNRFIDKKCPDGYFYTAGKKWTPTVDLDNDKRVDTLYVGKRANDKMLRFYDKLKQISKNNKIPVLDANGNEISSWMRYETEFHTKYSNSLFYSLLTIEDFDIFAYANKHDAYNNYISALPYYAQSKWASENGDRKAEYDPVYKMKILYNREYKKMPKGVDFI